MGFQFTKPGKPMCCKGLPGFILPVVTVLGNIIVGIGVPDNPPPAVIINKTLILAFYDKGQPVQAVITIDNIFTLGHFFINKIAHSIVSIFLGVFQGLLFLYFL